MHLDLPLINDHPELSARTSLDCRNDYEVAARLLLKEAQDKYFETIYQDYATRAYNSLYEHVASTPVYDARRGRGRFPLCPGVFQVEQSID